MKTVLTIVGARPQFVKAAVVSKALAQAGIHESIVHTGQHYDYEMSSVFWEELNLPAPALNLEIGSGTHGKQTGLMMQKLEEYILRLPNKPDALLVYGDTNSTLAGALVASKLHIPVLHVEAGLRSFNRKMPEEINRVLTDHASDYLFCSSQKGVDQLKSEGITKNVFNVGDVMYDSVVTFSEIADRKYTLKQIIPFQENEYYLATIHRPANTDNEDTMLAIVEAFGALGKPVVWPVHPRNKARINNLEIPQNLHLITPVSYFEMLILLENSNQVITDSGGLQKEAYWMKKPCITVRAETEWTETLQGNWNILVAPNEITAAVDMIPTTPWKPLYGDGRASEKIAEILRSKYGKGT